MLYNADCLDIMQGLEDALIDMIYLDPPFYSQQILALSDKNGKEYRFSDIWNSLNDYLNYMKIRIWEMRRILKPTGSLFLHCDTSASHHLRILLDDIFGTNNFQSEIIWSYKRWSNSQKGLLPAHQTILYYTKGKDYKFNTIYGNYSVTTNIDQILQERKRDQNGKSVYKRDSKGNVIQAKEKKGVPISDVWEIPFLNPKARERTGYPTQKPIELLDRIITISTNKGDLVLDPFCGSGTTLVSAKLLERNYIGIDINPDAIVISTERLKAPYKTESQLLKVGMNAYQTKTDDELAILRQFDCEIVQRNKGIDAFLRKHYLGRPVAIRIQRKTETLSEALTLLHNSVEKKGCSYAVLITHEKVFNQANIPENILIINDYNTQFEIEINEKLQQINESANSSDEFLTAGNVQDNLLHR